MLKKNWCAWNSRNNHQANRQRRSISSIQTFADPCRYHLVGRVFTFIDDFTRYTIIYLIKHKSGWNQAEGIYRNRRWKWRLCLGVNLKWSGRIEEENTSGIGSLKCWKAKESECNIQRRTRHRRTMWRNGKAGRLSRWRDACFLRLSYIFWAKAVNS